MGKKCREESHFRATSAECNISQEKVAVALAAHRQSPPPAWRLKLALLYQPKVVVVNIPYHLSEGDAAAAEH